MPDTSVYRSYAKINLFLDVLDRRPDGYHNIETIFQTVTLSDSLAFARQEHGIELTCSVPELPTGGDNLVCRAAQLLLELAGVREGARIRLDKEIPVAAGLAGGSGNAAAALVALNELWGLGLGEDELLGMGARLGADVPYCIVGGTVAATGRGDELTPLPPAPPAWFVLLHPPISVSTASVYNSPALAHNLETPVDGRTPTFQRALDALRAGDWARVVFNRMESAVFPGHPELAKGKQRLVDAGCVAAAMSGSGPTLFGVCEDEGQAREVAAAFRDMRVSVVQANPAGVTRLD